MRPGDALILNNFFPNASDISLRKGSASYKTGLGTTAIETLASYAPPSGAISLWAWAGTSLYDASNPGAFPAATLTGLTNARWFTTNFTTAGGNFLIAANGVDKVLLYNGTTWEQVDGSSAHAITGVATTALNYIHVHQNRVWYIENATFHVWYSAVTTMTGALTKFDLSSVFSKGGSLAAMGSWTLDSGTGPEDLAVFISTKGEVAVYQGIDPTSASTWALVGVYNIGEPVGQRPLMKYKGDLAVITNEGLNLFSRALIDSQTTTTSALSDRIHEAITSAVASYGNSFGWEITQFPGGNMLVMNVPVDTGAQQYVMNSTTGSWCQFTAWDASTFCVHNKKLYYGGKGKIVQAWTGSSDEGKLINGECLGAYDYFRNRNGTKEITLFRPVIGWDSNPSIFLVGVDVDFVYRAPTGAISFPAAAGAIWDTSKWDESVWGGSVTLNSNWYTVNGIGFAIAPHILISTASATVKVAAFDFTYKQGAIL
jgi:hypothetical protein